MNNIELKLAKYQNLIPRERGIKEIIISTINRLVGITLDPKKIRVNGHFCSLVVLPMIRQEILIHKEEIISSLRSKNHNIKNIF